MSQETRDKLVFYVLLGMKILTTLRTGIDTYTISKDILNVLLLDGVFLALWFVLAYGGKGQIAMAIRPFAAFGSYLMYAFMLGIGWEAHVNQPLVAVAVRVAGALILLYDTWDYAVAWNQRRIDLLGKTSSERQRNWRDKAWEKAYKKALKKAEPDIETQSSGLLSGDLEADTDYRQTLPILPPPIRKQLTAGTRANVPNVPNVLEEREIDTSRASIQRRWNAVYTVLPDTFRRSDVEELGKCRKTQAFEAITYGKQRGEVLETAERGVYRKVTIVEGESTPDQPTPDQDTKS